ncbi:lig_chan-Glu_bd domain-containing protein [Caerostris extrusa]|uniref:Lig_chan-Glu_bd domain-containing protein n=1 Tax=Caerostris extrusa TaxID=172846 RepID=A0AAV4RYM0_CAEEX|nr:lig_chan-Glu_bd domain-containing protein [Caerostris extrusa]
MLATNRNAVFRTTKSSVTILATTRSQNSWTEHDFSFEVEYWLSSSKNLFEIKYKNGNLQLGGMEGRFLDLLSKALRFKYHLKSPVDGEPGRMIGNGNWTGLFGMIQRQEIDIAFSTLSITEERMQVADFSEPYTSKDLTFLVEKPGALPARWAMFHPFDMTTWSFIMFILLMGPCVLMFSLNLKVSYNKLLFQLFGSILKQQLTINMKFYRCKVFLIFWCVYAFLISLCYSTILLSSLTVPFQKEPLKNFLELSQAVRRRTYKCFSVKGSSLVSILQASQQEHLSFLGKAIEENEWYYSLNNLNVLKQQKEGQRSQ